MQFEWDKQCVNGHWNQGYLKKNHAKKPDTGQKSTYRSQTIQGAQYNQNEEAAAVYCSEEEELIEEISHCEDENDTDILSKDFKEFAVIDKRNKERKGNKAVVKDEIRKVWWKDLNLHPRLKKGIESLNFFSLTTVQIKVLQVFLENDMHNAVICAPSKSGKTISVLIGTLNYLLCEGNNRGKYPRAIMLYPTHELAEVAYMSAKQLSTFCDLKLCLALRGVCSKRDKITEDMIFVTPEKVMELADSSFDLKKIKFLSFDEADYLSNRRGNLSIVAQIRSRLSKCHFIVSTSQINKILDEFINKYLYAHVGIEIEDREEKQTKEIYLTYNNINDRVDALIFLEAFKLSEGQTVVFCETKDVILKLKEKLSSTKLSFEILIGGKNGLKDAQRKSVLEQFSKKEIKVLITTRAFISVIPRQIVKQVINFDPILTEDLHFNFEMYSKRKCLLKGEENGLIINFIEKGWEEHLLKQILSQNLEPKQPSILSVAHVIDGVEF